MRDHGPSAVARIHDVMLPHDYLTWQLTSGRTRPRPTGGTHPAPATGRPPTNGCLPELFEQALGRGARLPRIAAAREVVGSTDGDISVGPGTGDNMAAALGLGLRHGRRRCLDRDVGCRLDGDHRARLRRHRSHLRLRRRDRWVPAARLHHQRRPDPRAGRPPARGRPRRPGDARTRVGARRPRPDAAPLPRRGADPGSVPRPPAHCTG